MTTDVRTWACAMGTEVQTWACAMGTEGMLLLGVALERHEQMSIHSNRAPVTGHTNQPINKSSLGKMKFSGLLKEHG